MVPDSPGHTPLPSHPENTATGPVPRPAGQQQGMTLALRMEAAGDTQFAWVLEASLAGLEMKGTLSYSHVG